jgi:hypothetical protein
MLVHAISVLVASLLGSLHCVGMCGPFVGLVVPRRGPHKPVAPLFAYHLGRLTSYLALGALAGGVGMALDTGGDLFGLQRAATVLAGISMIAIGAISLWKAVLRSRSVPRLRATPGAGPRAWLKRMLRVPTAATRRLGPTSRGAVLGIVSALMPCGWLWAFVVAAAGTGSPAHGVLTMVAFWLGTVPSLTVVGLLAHRFARRVRSRVPVVLALLVIAIGVYAVAFRARIDPAPTSHGYSCH